MVFHWVFFFILSGHVTLGFSKLSFFLKINLRSLLNQEIVLKFFLHIVNVCLHLNFVAV